MPCAFCLNAGLRGTMTVEFAEHGVQNHDNFIPEPLEGPPMGLHTSSHESDFFPASGATVVAAATRWVQGYSGAGSLCFYPESVSLPAAHGAEECVGESLWSLRCILRSSGSPDAHQCGNTADSC